MRVSGASFLFVLVYLLTSTFAAFGPIGTSRPGPPGGSIANDAPPTAFFQGTTGPYPTNDWWVGYGAAPRGDAYVAGPFPYQSRLLNSSLEFGIPAVRNFDGTSVQMNYQMDWGVSFTEHSGRLADHKVLSWDTQTVTLQYFSSSGSVTSYMVPGSPYMTFNFAGATPRFLSTNDLLTSFAGQNVVNNGGAVTSSGTKFKIVNKGGTYIIYSLNGPLTLSATASSNTGQLGTITASGKFSGAIRIVKLTASGHEATLDTYVGNYATAVTTDYTFSGDTATLIFTWNVVGNGNNLLHLTWPHHRVALQSPNFLPTTSLSYLTTKGYMYPALGATWRMNYALPTITWNAPRSPHSSCVSAIIKGLEYEIQKLASTALEAPGDFYFWGGNFGAKARLALIAEQVGRNDLIAPVVTWLKGSFAYWTAAGSPTQVAYETGWGAIINKAGYNNVWVDFGNGYMNDHHFHYGYLLAGAAIIAKYDGAWLNANREFVNWFLRDIVNPSRADPYFTPTRCRDWFAGHSWASGIHGGAGARNQESVGESVNGYYGALLWAEVTGNTDIKNYARLLIANEQQAAKIYWHLYPNSDPNARDQPYPEQGLRNLVTIGNVLDWQAGAWLFWGAQKVQIAAIQILPVTPVNEYMYDTDWVRNVYSYTSGELNDPTYGDEWKSVIYLAYSQYDPQTAARLSGNLAGWGTGNTYSNQLYFLSTRPNPSGQPICTADTANPEGNFLIQDAGSGRYVTSSAARLELMADSTNTDTAIVYQFGFAPGGGTIRAVVHNQFVTSDNTGVAPLAAARAVASSWEIFIVRQKVGAASGIYSILAASNRKYVQLNGSGALVNTGATEASSTGFRLVSAAVGQVPLPSSGTLVHDSTGRAVAVGAPLSDPWLRTVTGGGTPWNFVKLTVENGVQIWGIQEADNKLFVTSDNSGADQLRAFREVALGWEYFVFQPAGGCKWTLKMTVNGNLVGVRSNGALFADQSAVGAATVFRVVGAGCPA